MPDGSAALDTLESGVKSAKIVERLFGIDLSKLAEVPGKSKEDNYGYTGEEGYTNNSVMYVIVVIDESGPHIIGAMKDRRRVIDLMRDEIARIGKNSVEDINIKEDDVLTEITARCSPEDPIAFRDKTTGAQYHVLAVRMLDIAVPSESRCVVVSANGHPVDVRMYKYYYSADRDIGTEYDAAKKNGRIDDDESNVVRDPISKSVVEFTTNDGMNYKIVQGHRS